MIYRQLANLFPDSILYPGTKSRFEVGNIMRTIILNSIKNEKGAATVMEAVIVFPIMIVVIVFLIYLGNGMYQMSKISAAVSRYAIEGAQMCTDPYYYDIEGKSEVPSSYESGIQPYRYLLQTDKGHIQSVTRKIEKSLSKAINSSGYFMGMEPKIYFQEVNYNNHFFYSTFSCEVRYRITMGIKLIGDKDFKVIDSSAYAEVAVNDPADFIRNTNMVIDYVQGTEIGSKITEKISSAMGKVQEFLGLLGE